MENKYYFKSKIGIINSKISDITENIAETEDGSIFYELFYDETAQFADELYSEMYSLKDWTHQQTADNLDDWYLVNLINGEPLDAIYLTNE